MKKPAAADMINSMLAHYDQSVHKLLPADGLIALYGADKPFARHLDSLFTMEMPDRYFAETEDITRDGILGSYVHGNEPSHHVAYLYNRAGEPWNTRFQVHRIIKGMYHSRPDGLCGNDDCGQMSAWYIFSAMGFYPVCPGSDRYDIGSPCVDEARIRLDNGNEFLIKAINRSEVAIYIQSATLNGKPWHNSWILHSDMMKGGELVFRMGKKPNKNWGLNDKKMTLK